MAANKPKSGRSGAEIDSSHVHTAVVANQYVLVRHSHTWSPPTDIFEIDDSLLVLVEIAGMQKGNFNVAIGERHLIISGSRPAPHNIKAAFHQMEVRHGDFRVDVDLPWSVDEDRVEATYDDGFLRVSLPKVKAQHIHVVDVEITET